MSNFKNVKVGLDIGFGDIKICIDGICSKEVTALARVNSDVNVNDVNAVIHEGNSFYVFNTATKLPKENQLPITNYQELKIATPIFIKGLEAQRQIKIEKICLGLSLVMIENAADYRAYVSKSCNIDPANIELLPQGLGSKVAYDTYNLNPNDKSRLLDTRSQNYLGVDLGFNTMDVFQVIDGKVSSNTVAGFERLGVIKVAEILQSQIKQNLNRDVGLETIKETIKTGELNNRGNSIQLSAVIEDIIEEYIFEIMHTVEEKFGSTIDKVTNILLIGGGAALYNKVKDREKLQTYLSSNYGDNFILVPELPEFFNCLGYFLFINR